MQITRLPWPAVRDSKESAFHIGDPGLIRGWGRFLAKEITTTPVFLPGEFPRTGWRSLVSYQPMGSQRVGDMTE